MGYDATGKLVYGPNNLFLQSEDCGNASWNAVNGGVGVAPTKTSNYALAPDGTMTAARWQCSLGGGTTSADVSFVGQGPSGIIRINCVMSAWLRTADGSTQTVYMQAGSVTEIKTVTGTWAQYFIAGNPGAGNTCGIGLKGAQVPACPNTLDLLAWRPQVEAVTYQTTPSTYYPTTTAAYYGPRLVYDPVTLASQGILVEEARTNNARQSQTLDEATWVKSGVTVTANATASPDGTTNADALVEDGATSQHQVNIFTTVATTTVYTVSAYLKAGTRSWARVRVLSGATDISGDINLSTGALGTVAGPATWSVQTLPNGWYRLAGVFTSAASTSSTTTICAMSADNTASYTGVNGNIAIYAWQAQLEAGTGASSPIPTTTAAVTRAADNVNFTGLSAPAPYSVVSEFNVPRTASGVDIVNWGTLANGAGQYLATSGLAYVRESSSTTALVIGATVTANVTQKMAARYAVNDVNLAVNGTLATADTSVNPPATMANLALSNSVFGFGGININGTISRIRIYNRALPDAQLQSLTT
jgi:hypothetical protein